MFKDTGVDLLQCAERSSLAGLRRSRFNRAEARGGDRHPSRPKKSSTTGVDCVLHDVSLHLWALVE
jgi:hypothetical protein